MSSSRHPVALRLEQRVGGDTRLLATVMLLPLVDGIFAALVLAGGLDTYVGIAQIGLLVFGGSATLAVILAEMDDDPRSQAATVLVVGIPLMLVAAAEAALAPAIETVVDIPTFERFAALVILAIAAKTASSTIGDYLPSPGIIIGLGFVASVQPAGAELVLAADPVLMLRAAAAGGVAVAFALAVVALQPYLREVVDIDRFRFGSAVALGTLALSIFGLVPSQSPLVVFGVAGLLAFDPEAGADTAPAPAPAVDDGPGGEQPATPDGGNDPDDDEAAYGYPGEDGAEERAPWL
ncbi:DUF5794 domain-containing protein [Halobacterium sp. R2-5]|uniref:DUF5794 domain-containing protein n=1 Tax=Halobacterium sp. R2-5 TaxID=2715751 RepID=UPI001423ABDE|nr:DUF5794 domain-containing protein [Halobacterium sp. R2-5]NIB99392.1 hypothetical protein [Halobacterium sp. R2-5]